MGRSTQWARGRVSKARHDASLRAQYMQGAIKDGRESTMHYQERVQENYSQLRPELIPVIGTCFGISSVAYALMSFGIATLHKFQGVGVGNILVSAAFLIVGIVVLVWSQRRLRRFAEERGSARLHFTDDERKERNRARNREMRGGLDGPVERFTKLVQASEPENHPEDFMPTGSTRNQDVRITIDDL